MKNKVRPLPRKSEPDLLASPRAAGSMNAPSTLSTPKLSLSVQYALAAKSLPRWRLRRWIGRAVVYGANLSVKNVQLTLRLVGSVESQQLNFDYRTKPKPTNVLTFTYNGSDTDTLILADIVICTPVLKAEARAQGKAYLDHAAHLVVHGTLHALGYDHVKPAQARLMENLEREILASLSIDDPYTTEKK
jgi:probable rRNA maturation factor